MGHEKNMNSIVIPKSPKVGGKVEKIGLGSFNIALFKSAHVPYSTNLSYVIHTVQF